MQYLLDGYNFLFSFLQEQGSLQAQRESLISFLSEQLKNSTFLVVVVFDAPKTIFSFRDYTKNLQIRYSPEKISADDYILEIIDGNKHPAEITVVTSDKALAKKSIYKGANSINPKKFLEKVAKNKSKGRGCAEKDLYEPEKEKERLRKIFEKKLQQEDSD